MELYLRKIDEPPVLYVRYMLEVFVVPYFET